MSSSLLSNPQDLPPICDCTAYCGDDPRFNKGISLTCGAVVPDSKYCDKCDGAGNFKTFRNQVSMAINGKVQCIDWCIHHIIAALNAGGVETVASCCGHGEQEGRIDLKDGRILKIVPPRATEDASRKIESRYRDGLLSAADICFDADKSTHPTDLGEAILKEGE